MAPAKILLIDDDKDQLRLLDAKLTASGYDVVSASDGLAAVMVAQREKPNVIILDILLPGAGGFVVMNRLKSLKPLADVPIIILTVTVARANKQRALEAGAHAFLEKPVDDDVLLAAIGNAREKSSGPA